MTDVRAAYDPNRLPWLNDTGSARERRAARTRRNDEWRMVALWGLIALILVAAVGYWVGMQSVARIEADAAAESWGSEATAVLPAPKVEETAPPQVEPAPSPELEPAAPPPVARMVRPQTVALPEENAPLASARPAEQPATEQPDTGISPAEPPAAAAAPPVPSAAVTKPAPLTLWPADVSEGAAGRAVRIGTFPNRLGAKKAWSRIVRVYPGMRRLKAVVVPVPSMRNGRTYYRLQFGTTSQAHSAVLCQRMRIVGQSCVVIGTPAA